MKPLFSQKYVTHYDTFKRSMKTVAVGPAGQGQGKASLPAARGIPKGARPPLAHALSQKV